MELSEEHRALKEAYAAQCVCAWPAIESNPDSFNELTHRLGLPEPWHWTDVFGLDSELLEMVPQPVAAVTLVYPSNSVPILDFKAIQRAGRQCPPGPFYMHQRVRNACGTVAAVHAIANCTDLFQFPPDCAIQDFVSHTADHDFSERGAAFAGASQVKAAHDACLSCVHNQTVSPEAGSDIAEHFCAFVMVDNQLYELDGSLERQPLHHGPTTRESFLSDTAVLIQRLIAIDPGNPGAWNVMALVGASNYRGESTCG